MDEMLTAKEIQEMLQVDRSTIYRMADRGDLPAVKVGRQWRFPRESVESWLDAQTPATAASVTASKPSVDALADVASILPLDCVQLIQNAFSDLLGVMLVITDLEGEPITEVSNPIPLYRLLAGTEKGHDLCRETWRDLGQAPALRPHFQLGFGDLLCARAFVRLKNELKGMVIAFGVAPEGWSLPRSKLEEMAQAIQIDSATLYAALQKTPELTAAEQQRVTGALQSIADILAHIAEERYVMVGRLQEIARLSAL